MAAASEFGRIAIVSPHLDDGVFACGELIAAARNAAVITVFAGVPDDPEMLTEWDRASGFASAREAVERRRGEDRAALAELDAQAVWLDFCDSQYGQTPQVQQVADVLRNVLSGCDTDSVFVPAGLFHSDHVLAHEAAMLALRDGGACRCFMYEDALYRRIDGLLQQRLAALLAQGVAATPVTVVASDLQCSAAKRRAVQHYASQLQALATPGRPGHEDLEAPERYWRLGRS